MIEPQILKGLYRSYRKETAYFPQLQAMSFEAFTQYPSPYPEGLPCVIDRKVGSLHGAMFYDRWENEEIHVRIPLNGLWFDSTDSLHRLFTEVTDQCIGEKPCTF